MDEHPEQQTEENLRKCAICNRGIPERPYQAQSVRTCSPGCAKLLAVREHPDIDSGSHASWRRKLTVINRTTTEETSHENPDRPSDPLRRH
jgi:hypothetical protein